MPRAVADLQQQRLWTDRQSALPAGYEPLRPDRFEVDRIYLAKGSLATPERARFVERICALYPDAERIECSGTPHNRIDLGVADPLARHGLGKRTLVFGEHKSAVRKSDEEGNTCPNYWHFSPYGFCFYGCRYCYLAGTAGVWFSPTVKIYVNLPEIVREIDRVANRLADPTAFYVGKLQDGLALDPLTAYSTVRDPFQTAVDHPPRLAREAEGRRVARVYREALATSETREEPAACFRIVNAVPERRGDRRAEGEQGLTVKVCACKNPDLASGSCGIAGDWADTEEDGGQISLLRDTGSGVTVMRVS